MQRINYQWRLAARPQGLFKQSDFQWVEEPMQEPQEGQVLVRNDYLSLDPTQIIWASMDAYLPAVRIGDVMRSGTVGVVEASQHPGFKPGDLVTGMQGWQKYGLSDGSDLSVLPQIPGLPVTAFLGLFGHIGLTAYYGLLDIGQPKPGETLVVTAAAGAVGSLVGQIGKIKGCRVVGIAGSDEKCRWITEELGFDAAINYKTENVREQLQRHCPNGIDIDFENVGGPVLDDILSLINNRARIVLCGLVSQYTNDQASGPKNLGMLGIRRARIEGFIVLDYLPRAQEAMAQLGQWLGEGKLKYRVDVVDGLEHAPLAVNRLFDGTHNGKLVVRI